MRHPQSALLAATLLALPGQAAAQQIGRQSPAKELVEPAQSFTAPDVDFELVGKPHADKDAEQSSEQGAEAKKKSKKADLLIVPIPMSSPALGTGVTVAAVLFYNPNDSPQPWISGVGGAYTTTKTWAAGAFHSMSLGHDTVRLLAFAGYGDANLNFYGIGPGAGQAGLSVDINQKGLLGMLDAQTRFFRRGPLSHVYFGARMEYLKLDSSITIPHPNRPDLNPPPIELHSTLASVGPSFTFDSRDIALNPSKGIYVQGSWMFGASFLGSDFESSKLNLAANSYIPVAKHTIVGLRAALCGSYGRAPFYDLCMFGQQSDLRGYETGRYRDGASWALQGEIRQHLFGKFGIVGFAGVGGIAPSVGDIGDQSTVLTAGGVGLRYMASKSNKVNLRLDVAFGQDGKAIYFGIGEAF